MNKEYFQKILGELSSRAQLPHCLHAHAKRLMNKALIFTSWPVASKESRSSQTSNPPGLLVVIVSR